MNGQRKARLAERRALKAELKARRAARRGLRLVDHGARRYWVDATGAIRREDFPTGRLRQSKKARLAARRAGDRRAS